MKVLVVSPVHPYPPDIGDKIRIYNSVKKLNESNEVSLLSIGNKHTRVSKNNKSLPCKEAEYVGRPKKRWEALLWSFASLKSYRSSKFENQAFRKKLVSYLTKNKYEVIWVHFMNMVRYLHDPKIKEALSESKIVLDQHNDFERYWSTYMECGSYTRRAWAWWNRQRVRALRKELLPICDVVLSVSEDDAENTRKVTPKDVPVWLAPNGVDLEYFNFKNCEDVDSESVRLVYVGSMDVNMNADAVIWFVDNILPIIQERVPGTKFDIVGRNPTAEVQMLESTKGVRVTGRVEDVRPFYRRATIAVVPSRLGGGTKLKVLEAMSMGVPLVATSVGARGLNVEGEKHLKIADTERSFADAVVELMNNPDRAEQLAKAARKRVENQYSWSAVYEKAINRIEKNILTRN